MESARIILTGRLANYLEQLHCRRDVSYRCRICRSYPVGYRTHRCKHIAVYSTTLLRRERSFFISIMVSSCTGREGTLFENYLRSCQPRDNCAQKTIPITFLPLQENQPQENHRRLYQPGETLCKVIYKKVCPEKEADRIGFEKLPNSKSFVICKTKFKYVRFVPAQNSQQKQRD